MQLRFLAPLAAAFLCLTGSARAADLQSILRTAMTGTKVPAMGVLVIKDRKVEGMAVRGVRRNDRPDPVRPGDGNGSGVLVAANAGPDMGGETAAKAALKAAVAHIAPLAAAQGPARAASH